MKAVILAAGMGIRLHEDEHPKCLTVLANGQTILERQIQTLTQYISIHDILIVIGHLKEQILAACPNLLFVYNADYRKENTSKSLLRALYKIDDDVLWLNGDVVYHPVVLQRVFESLKTGMIVNQGAVGEEEVKYRCDSSGMIQEICKTVIDAEGEALGINYFNKHDAARLRYYLESCLPNDYFEKAIEMGIRDGMKISPFLVNRDSCTEIDFAEDLQHANQLLVKWEDLDEGQI